MQRAKHQSTIKDAFARKTRPSNNDNLEEDVNVPSPKKPMLEIDSDIELSEEK